MNKIDSFLSKLVMIPVLSMVLCTIYRISFGINPILSKIFISSAGIAMIIIVLAMVNFIFYRRNL